MQPVLKTRIATVLLCGVMQLTAALPAYALSFDTFLGSWSGQGAFLDVETQNQMRVRCALDGARKAPSSIELGLKCASRRGARTISIEIEKSADGEIGRVIVTLPSARAKGFSARISERSIKLEHPERGTLSIEETQGGMTLALSGIAALTGTILLE